MGRRVATVSIESGVRAARVAANLSQQELAVRVGVTRQAIAAIEANQYVPNTAVALLLAEALGYRVETLFALQSPAAPLPIHIVGDRSETQGRLTVGRVRGRWVGHPLVGIREMQQGFLGADGLIDSDGRPRLLASPERLEHTALLMGCDPSLGMLAAHLARDRPDLRVAWLPASSEAALAAVRDGEVHVGGSHLRDAVSGAYNVTQARRALSSAGGLVVGYADWELGFVVPVGNPKAIRAAADLARRGVRVVNRERGSGGRVLLDELLSREGIPATSVEGYDRVAGGHLAVATAVASGGADAGIALRATARALGLDFVPLAEARFDLVIPRDLLAHPAVAALLDVLQSRSLRADIRGLAGYDVDQMGTVRESLPAAA